MSERPTANRSGRSARATQKLLTLQQAESELGLPYTTLRDLCINGHLPVVRLGDSRRIWVKRVDLDRLIERSTEIR